MPNHLRIARPVRDLEGLASLWAAGMGWEELGRFTDHDGFDGVMLGEPGAGHHVEFTRRRGHPPPPRPDPEDLLVVYEPDAARWERACARLAEAGFLPVVAVNPYWDAQGRTFEDPEGHRVVVQRRPWPPEAPS